MRFALVGFAIFISVSHAFGLDFLTSVSTCNVGAKFESQVGVIDEILNLGPKCSFDHGLAPTREANEKMMKRKWKTTPFWAQEAIGADLASEFLAAQSKNMSVAVGVTDYFGTAQRSGVNDREIQTFGLPDRKGQRDHGDQVINLIEDSRYGGSLAVRWAFLNEMANGPDPLHLAQAKAKIINASVGGIDNDKRREVEAFIERGGIFVKSTGNDYPEQNPFENLEGLISAGAMGPNGLTAPYTQSGATVVVPSDGIQSSQSEVFSGTSAASPLLTAALTNALALNPQLTPAQAIKLLKATSIPTFESRVGKGAAPNMLNSYRLVRISACLASSQSNCSDFAKEARRLRADSKKLINAQDCGSIEQGLKKLRAAYLLSPNDEGANLLAAAYEKLGFSTTAQFYRSLMKEQSESYFDQQIKDPLRRESRYFSGATSTAAIQGLPAIATASRLPSSNIYFKKAFGYIQEKSRNPDGSTRRLAAEQAAAIGPRALPLLERMLDDRDEKVALAAARGMRLMTLAQGPSRWSDEALAFVKRKGLRDRISIAYN